MASDEEILENSGSEEAAEDEVARLMKELNLDEDMQIPEGLDLGDELSDELNIDDPDLDSLEDEIPSEEVLDMDEIDAILSDISDIHPERNISAEELEERIAKYEEDPEAAEEALLEGDEEESSDNAEAGAEETESVSADIPEIAPEVNAESISENSEESTTDDNILDDDFLSSLENVEDMLADVENKANEEAEKINSELAQGEDADVDEINDILKKSDNNEAVNDDLLHMIEGLDEGEEQDSDGMFDASSEEETAEEIKKEKKKKKKKKKKGEDSESEENAEGSDLEFDEKAPGEKKGLFAKLFGFMFEEGDEEEEGEEGEKAEGEGAPKDKKKDKKGKKAKGKGKGKGDAPVDENAAIEAELEEEDKKSKKKKKDKKEKKPKKDKPKKEKKKEEVEEPKSGVKKPAVIVSGLFCITVLAIVMLFAVAGPKLLARKEARVAYYLGDYETASNKLYGLKLSKSDELIFQKASLLYKLELYMDKADAYELTGNEKKYLDSLLAAYNESVNVYPTAEELSITDEVNEFRGRVAERINEKYTLSQADIEEICAMKPVYYTIAVENIVAGRSYKDAAPDVTDIEPAEEIQEEVIEETELEDLLPEEELINR